MKPMVSAKFWRESHNGASECMLCPHNCVIEHGNAGACGAHRNIGGKLFAESYGRVTSLALDPIEKKPLYHFYPNSMILSLGGYGCNFRCPFCQNHEISMHESEYRDMHPRELAELSLGLAGKGNIGVAYTYNEPLIGYEFVSDCAELIRSQGQKNVLVTNGFISELPLRELLPMTDAMNIDLKSFSNEFYNQIGGNLEVVKQTIAAAIKKCHVEVTTLIIPGKNDSEEETGALASWLASVSGDTPLHLSRFFPRYKMLDLPSTPIDMMHKLEQVAKRHLKYVYLGNC